VGGAICNAWPATEVIAPCAEAASANAASDVNEANERVVRVLFMIESISCGVELSEWGVGRRVMRNAPRDE
jgi:hypothetical protein